LLTGSGSSARDPAETATQEQNSIRSTVATFSTEDCASRFLYGYFGGQTISFCIKAGNYSTAYLPFVLTLFVFDSTYNFEKNRVINLKRGLDEINYGNKTYNSSIKKGNHNAAVIINFVAGNAEYYHFYCYNDNN
jgi:hypothetical protein